MQIQLPIEEIIKTTPADTIVAVYVKKFVCDRLIDMEKAIQDKMTASHLNFAYYSMCYTEDKLPWPEPHTNRVYFFQPPHPKYVLAVDAFHLVKEFNKIVLTIGKTQQEVEQMLAEGKFDEVNPKLEHPPVVVPDNVQMPGIGTMAKNLVKQTWDSAKGFANGGSLFATEETYQKRIEICRSCDQYIDKRCLQCGCFMEQKTKVQATTCPLKKW